MTDSLPEHLINAGTGLAIVTPNINWTDSVRNQKRVNPFLYSNVPRRFAIPEFGVGDLFLGSAGLADARISYRFPGRRNSW